MPERVRRVEETFRRIQQERMQGLPVLNPRLRVEAVGFREWPGAAKREGGLPPPAAGAASLPAPSRGILGVLITPWFMNLMLLPGAGEGCPAPSVGREVRHRFPAGSFTFLVGHESGIGSFQSCSLFSPMFEFEDQAAAVATAKAVLEALFPESAEAAAAGDAPPSPGRRELLRRMLPRRAEGAG